MRSGYSVHRRRNDPYSIGNIRIGSPICEDAWHPEISETLVETGAELLLVPNGSPYSRTKHDLRVNTMVSRVIETGLPLIYLNTVGGQDDQVFDGGSFVLNPGGELAVQLPFFEECHQTVEFTFQENKWVARKSLLASQPSELEKDYHAMVEGLRDYTKKPDGFEKVVRGMSGGIDSALVAATIAADALRVRKCKMCNVTVRVYIQYLTKRRKSSISKPRY